jgi:hypothetical protein
MIWVCTARREGFEPPNRQFRRLVIAVGLVGSRPIPPAHVGYAAGPVGSGRLQTGRLDDHRMIKPR